MKILNLIQCLNLGGMEKATYNLVYETQTKGVDWQIQSITPAGDGKNLFTSLGIIVEDNSYNGKLGYKSHFSLRKKIKKFTGDIILVTGPTLTGCWGIKDNQQKKILAIHYCHKYGNQNLLKWKLFYKYFGNDYNAIICHSPYLLEQTQELAPHLKNKLRLIENSTQIQEVSQEEKIAAKKKFNIPDKSFVIGNAGWLIERKRFDIFLKVCAKLVKDNQKLFCLIAGDGPLRKELEDLSIELGISEVVNFIGWQQNIEDFYRAIDLLLFNSNSDAFGRTVMEAMGYGIPVVASVLEGGTDSVLIHQENGYLITDHNINHLAEYCFKLMIEKDLYYQFQSASIETIYKRFNNNLYIQKYLEVFDEVLN
ncbi:glycosyl transferase [Tolypothrix tenuis PCC 7101]|uniref:Glycosyl transferase n=2 Tax=Tolypothrix TaxID=111782 RepID=A0A1Z4MVY5_9CYAN|nr:glycosyltransferase [Aulosira sp. FACHB-113]BAY97608.1 glycosyl transferase [Tolypothrix tenuis PCC 7101]BAZ71884.1 glycosyl transferase [Aulosira laxa NIES-50]